MLPGELAVSSSVLQARFKSTFRSAGKGQLGITTVYIEPRSLCLVLGADHDMRLELIARAFVMVRQGSPVELHGWITENELSKQ